MMEYVVVAAVAALALALAAVAFAGKEMSALLDTARLARPPRRGTAPKLSPVAGTVLMVAITVVLAAVLYAMVASLR